MFESISILCKKFLNTFVINTLDNKIFDIPDGRLFILTNNEETRNFYFELLRKKGKQFSWFLYDDFCWMTII